MWILMIAWLGVRSFILNFLLKTQTQFVQWVSSCSNMWQNNAKKLSKRTVLVPLLPEFSGYIGYIYNTVVI